MDRVPIEEEDLWELRHDEDGFTYKILKPRDVTSSTASEEPSPLDSEEQEKQRRERKRRTLLKLKDKYQKELDQWGILSNNIREMVERVKRHVESGQPAVGVDREVASSSNSLTVGGMEAQEASGSETIDKLLLQAEEQAMMIRKASDLCDIAEAMCNAHEERLAQSFIDLPIWSSPKELMTSLCDDQLSIQMISLLRWVLFAWFKSLPRIGKTER